MTELNPEQASHHSPKNHSTLISISALIVNALEFCGQDYRPIIEEAGFDADKIYIPTERVSVAKIKKLWELSLKYTDNACFGLIYARYIQPSALHGLGFSWLASHNLKEGLERLVRFQKILGTHFALKLRKTHQGYCLYESIRQADDCLQFPDVAWDAELASIYKICQLMMGPDFRPIRVSFEHEKPVCADQFEAFFGLPVQFNASETAIEFDKALCEQMFFSANPELARMSDQIVIDYLSQFEQEDIITQTRQYIIDQLPTGLPRQPNIARTLNLSLRNFQRKLTAHGTHYNALLIDIRYGLARQYLQSPHHSIIEITYLLGFADPSNFGRAFKRWSSQTPLAYRKAHAII